MAKVWKFPLALTDEQSVEMPTKAQPLHVAVQDGVLTLWARVDPSQHTEYRSVSVCGTGNPCPDDAEHIGSVFDGPFVWHVFVGS